MTPARTLKMRSIALPSTKRIRSVLARLYRGRDRDPSRDRQGAGEASPLLDGRGCVIPKLRLLLGRATALCRYLSVVGRPHVLTRVALATHPRILVVVTVCPVC